VAKVKVDPETGKISILKVFSAHDTGTVINPLTYQGQVEGGMMQGFRCRVDGESARRPRQDHHAQHGRVKNPLRRADVPALEILLFQDQDGLGPFHSKPLEEHSTVRTARCITNALYDAIGKQLTDLPLNSEAVYDAMRSVNASVKRSPPHSRSNSRRAAF
jgi:CO/xanthine dehydrogenase Mo-binding subunit